MHINQEAAERHAITAYSDTKIQINDIAYEKSLIVSREKIITDLKIKNISEMDDYFLELIMQLKPEVILIGHQQLGKFPPIQLITFLSTQRIGMECMSMGAACRTYNILLSEHRAVAAFFILPTGST